jgi:hypothetical protein
MLDLCALDKHGAHAVSLFGKLNPMPCTEVAYEDLGFKHSAWSICIGGSYVLQDISLGQLSGLMLLFVQR